MRPILMFLFIASMAYGQTTQDSTDNKESFLLNEMEWGGIQSVRLYLQASSNGPMWFGYGGEPHLNRATLLLSYLEDDKIADELELSSDQQDSVSRLLKEYSNLSKALYEKIESGEASVDSVKDWIRDQGTRFEQELDRVLLPHQIELLAKIQINYMVAAFGFSRVLEFANQRRLVKTPPDMIRTIARRERELASYLRRRCDDFSQTQLKRVLDVLNENQRKQFNAKVDKIQFTTYPELISAQAEWASSNKKEHDPQFVDKYGEWGLTVAWVVKYSGTLEPQFKELSGYELDYLVTALAKDQRLMEDVGILEYQLESLNSIREEFQKRNRELGQQVAANPRNSDELIADWKQGKRRYITRELDQVLLPFQKMALEDETHLVRLRKLGVISYLTNEGTASRLELSSRQIAEIKTIARTIPEDYLEFSRKTVKWSIEHVLQDVEDGTREKNDLIELFDSSYRVVSMPVGCLAETLTRNAESMRK